MKKLIFSMFLVLLTSLAMPIYAGMVEIANVSAHYAHPIFQTVEDSGNDSAIGQGMSESVLDAQALIETDDSGQVYGTFRLHLRDQISGYRLYAQTQGERDFYALSPQVMKDDGEAIDLRVALPSKDAILRFDLDITAMGRNVIFYGAILDRVEGNTDFIVSISQNSSAEANDEGLTLEKEADKESVIAPSLGEKLSPQPVEKKEDSELKAPALDGKIGLLLKGDPRLNETFSSEHDLDAEAPYGPLTLLALYSVFIVFGVLAFGCFFLGIGLMYYLKKLRFKNDIEEAKLYGFKKVDSE